jgi:hypothetical protein
MPLFTELPKQSTAYTKRPRRIGRIEDVVPASQKKELAGLSLQTPAEALLAQAGLEPSLRDSLAQALQKLSPSKGSAFRADVPIEANASATREVPPTQQKNPVAPVNDGKTVHPVNVVKLAYEAGFRGQDLIDIVAIVGRESSYNPYAHNQNRATRDDSYGLTQINLLGALRDGRLRAFGITDPAQLYDPATNLRAAYILYTQSGNTLRPWGGYKGLSNTYSTDTNAARLYVEQARQAGLIP